MVHLKTTFNKTTQMTRLLTMMRGEAKGLSESIDETISFMQELSNVYNENLGTQMVPKNQFLPTLNLSNRLHITN